MARTLKLFAKCLFLTDILRENDNLRAFRQTEGGARARLDKAKFSARRYNKKNQPELFLTQRNKNGSVSKRSQRGGLENRLGASPRGFESLHFRQ